MANSGPTSICGDGVCDSDEAFGMTDFCLADCGWPHYNDEGKFNVQAALVDHLHDTLFEDARDNFQCRNGMPVLSQNNLADAESCMSQNIAFILSHEMVPLTPSEKSEMHTSLLDFMIVVLRDWFSNDYTSEADFHQAVKQNNITYNQLEMSPELTDYLQCVSEIEGGELCASEFSKLSSDIDLLIGSNSRAIMGHSLPMVDEEQDDGQGDTVARAVGCIWCDTMDNLFGGIGAIAGGIIGSPTGPGAVAAGAIGAGAGAALGTGITYAVSSGMAPPPGGGTGIDCDLAADKEKCYDMRQLVYAHDLILDELTQTYPTGTDDFTWEEATRVLEAAYHIQDTEFGYRRCAANLDNGAPEASRGNGSDRPLGMPITAEASARSSHVFWKDILDCPPYNPFPFDDKPFLTFGGLNDEIGMCKEGDDTTGRAGGIPLRELLILIEWILDWIPGEDGFGLSASGTGFGSMTVEEIRVELSKDWSDSDDDHMQLARMQFTRSSNSDLFAMDSDADEQQLRSIGGMVDALVLYQTNDPAMAAAFSRIVDLVARSATGGYSPNMPVETPLKSCPIDFIETIDIENDEALLRYEIVDVEVDDSDNSTVTDDTTVSDDDNDDGFLPGFGFLSALVSLVGVAILLQRRQREDNN